MMKEQPPNAPFWPWLLALGGASVAVGYCLYQGDHAAAVAVTVVTLFALAGYCTTASRIVRLACGMAVASLATPLIAFSTAELLTSWFGEGGLVIGAAICSGLIVIGVSLLLRQLFKIVPEHPLLTVLDRWAGFGIGAVQGVGLCLVIAAGILVLEPLAKQRMSSDIDQLDHAMARHFSKRIVEYAGHTRRSALFSNLQDILPDELSVERMRAEMLSLNEQLRRPPSETERALEEHFSAR